jgi:hypothetical protein
MKSIKIPEMVPSPIPCRMSRYFESKFDISRELPFQIRRSSYLIECMSDVINLSSSIFAALNKTMRRSDWIQIQALSIYF